MKRGLAEVIAQDKNFCVHFGEVLNGKVVNESCITDIINRINAIFKKEKLEDIAGIFKACNFNLRDICDEIQIKEIAYNGKLVSKSILIQPSIFEMVCGLRESFKDLELIVDTLGDQNSQFSEVARILSIPITIIEDSKADMMIMASDLLVGQFARLIKDISLGSEDVLESDLKLIKNSFTPKKSPFQENSTLWFCKFSYDTWGKVNDALELKINNMDYINILKNQFHIFVK